MPARKGDNGADFPVAQKLADELVPVLSVMWRVIRRERNVENKLCTVGSTDEDRAALCGWKRKVDV
jgi:hypothetical protein